MEEALAFLFVLSILLAPVRIGASELLRPTLLLTFPLFLLYLTSRPRSLVAALSNRVGLASLVLTSCMLIGFLLRNDVIPGSDYRDLSVQSIISLPLTLAVAVYIGKSERFDSSVAVALLLGAAIHMLGAILIPPQVQYHDVTRATGFLSDPNIMLLHIIPPVALYFAMTKTQWFHIGIGTLAVVSMLWVVLLSMSRAGLVCLAVLGLAAAYVLAVAIVFGKVQLKTRALAYIFLVLAALYMAPSSSFAVIDDLLRLIEFRVQERVEDAGLVGDRVGLYSQFFDKGVGALLSPIGIGYGEALNGSSRLPHNSFMDSWIVGGVFGVLSMVYLYGEVLLRLLRRAISASPGNLKHVAHAAAFLCLLALVGSLSVFSWKCAWLYLGLAVGWLLRGRMWRADLIRHAHTS